MPAEDASHFDSQIAAGWERYRDRIFQNSRPVSEWLAQQIIPEPGATILELAAGPGETGFLVAERVGSKGRVISSDSSPEMVEAAKRGARAKDRKNIEFRVMDAQAIDLPDDSVDGVVCRFGVMLTPEPARVLAEARRVLRPGRRLAYAVWGVPDRNPWLMLVVRALTECGHAPQGDPVGPGGVFSLCEQQRNRELMAAAGYADVRVDPIAGFMRYQSTGDYWEFQCAVARPIAVLAASLDRGEIEAVLAWLEPALEPFRSGSGYDVPSLALGVAGRA
jgi:ubiquinone/menaquinone biosynthesis C-methylase UbiE